MSPGNLIHLFLYLLGSVDQGLWPVVRSEGHSALILLRYYFRLTSWQLYLCRCNGSARWQWVVLEWPLVRRESNSLRVTIEMSRTVAAAAGQLVRRYISFWKKVIAVDWQVRRKTRPLSFTWFFMNLPQLHLEHVANSSSSGRLSFARLPIHSVLWGIYDR